MDGEFESLTSYTSKSKRNYAGLLRFVLCACPLAVPGSVCGGSRLANRRPLRQRALPASAPGGGRLHCPRRFPALKLRLSSLTKQKRQAKTCLFCLAEMERLELSRRLPDLRP